MLARQTQARRRNRTSGNFPPNRPPKAAPNAKPSVAGLRWRGGARERAQFSPLGGNGVERTLRRRSGSGHRRETSQLSHPRLCDHCHGSLIGGPRKMGSRRKRHGGRGGADAPADCAHPLVPLKVNWPEGPREGGLGHCDDEPPWAKELAARRRRNPPAGNHRSGAPSRRALQRAKTLPRGRPHGPPL